MNDSIAKTVVKATAIYVLLAGLWILMSDLALSRFTEMPVELQRWQTVKGLVFVAISAIILAVIFTRHLHRQDRVEKKRLQAELQLQSQMEKLRKAHERISTITRHAPILMAVIDSDGRHRWVNHCWEETLGWTVEDAKSRDILEDLYPDNAYREVVGRFIDGAHGRWYDFKVRRRDGTSLSIEWLAVSLSDGSTLLFGRDVTSQKREQKFRDSLFRYSRDLLAVLGFDGYLREVNPAWEALLNRTENELLSRPLVEFVHPEDSGMTSQMITQLNSERSVVHFENRFVAGDGAIKIVAWNAFSLPEEKLIFAVGRDMSDQKQVERQLLQAQRMEGIGRLAGGVAHDFNNLLTVIIGQTQLAMIELDKGDQLVPVLEEVNLAARKAAELTRQLLVFSRKQLLEPQDVDLNEVIAELEPVLTRILGEAVELRIESTPTLPPVRMDPTHLEQVLMNLSVNAKDAMPGGGTLRVGTFTRRVREGEIPPSPKLAPGEYVVMEVEDTGTGIQADVLERIFEPFFTTKEGVKGTGLGLSTVYSIISQSGGDVTVTSTPGEGTSFSIWLPAVADEGVARTARQVVVRGGGETILLVDDDPGILGVLVRLLKSFGYRTLPADNPGTALQLSGEFNETIHLLLIDVVIPGMDGPTLAEKIRLQRPELKVLFLSGYSEQIRDVGSLPALTGFLAKPFSRVELAESIRRLLDSPS